MTVDELFPVDGKYTLGSLFDGAGGFPLAAQMCGITPLWASEIEPFPIAVTKARFPNMKHLGDVTKINGADIPPVDIICFGSPCQNLSIAGNRKGLSGDQSGLFLEAIRIIREMRKATHGKYPKFAIFENVLGTFSSNNGDDFKAVLEAFCNIRNTGELHIPKPKKWEKAGCIVGDNFSVGWRCLNAQHWGVPQRRRRLFLVADFSSERAGGILFKRDGSSRNFAEVTRPWKTATSDTGSGADCTGGERAFGFYPQMKPECVTLREDVANTLVNGTCPGFYNGVMTCTEGDAQAHSFVKVHRSASSDDATTWEDGDVANTLNVFDRGETRANELICVPQTLRLRSGKEGGGKGALVQTNITGTLAVHNDQTVFVPPTPYVCAFDRAAFNQGEHAQYTPNYDDSGIAQTIVARGAGGVCVVPPKVNR